MNKKFSTLVAGVLLASGVGASAQTFNPQVFLVNLKFVRPSIML